MVSKLTPTYMLCRKETKGFKIINKNRKINIEIPEPWYIYDGGERNPNYC